MKRIIPALLLAVAFLFGAVQPASAATPSLQQRNNHAAYIWSSCLQPYQAVWSDTRRVPSDIRDAAFNIGFYTCSAQTFKYTSRYGDMFSTTQRMYTINHQYYGKMSNSVAKVGTKLYAELVKKGLNPVGVSTWLRIIKGGI